MMTAFTSQGNIDAVIGAINGLIKAGAKATLILSRIFPSSSEGSSFLETMVDGLNFFVDASVRSLSLLAPHQACYLADLRTFDWIRDQFGSDATKTLARNQRTILGTRLLGQSAEVQGHASSVPQAFNRRRA